MGWGGEKKEGGVCVSAPKHLGAFFPATDGKKPEAGPAAVPGAALTRQMQLRQGSSTEGKVSLL